MVSRKLLKTEIDKVKNEHLELLYGIIKLLANGSQTAHVDASLDWHDFVSNTYGCLADTPISREGEGGHEIRERIE